jgi:hypothetical protein
VVVVGGRWAWLDLRQNVEGEGSFKSVARVGNLLVWLDDVVGTCEELRAMK